MALRFPWSLAGVAAATLAQSKACRFAALSISHFSPAAAKWTCTRVRSPWPSHCSTTPSPNFRCATLWPMFTALGSGLNNSRFVGGAGFSPLRVAVGAAIGGTASRVTGGKFANGAITGAFSQALNNERAEVEFKEQLKIALEGAAVEAAVAKSRIRRAIDTGGQEPVHLAQADLDAVRLHEALDLQLKGEYRSLNFLRFYGKAVHADGWFFKDGRASVLFQLEGTGPLLYGSDINYYYLGMATASAGRPTVGMQRAITVWNRIQMAFRQSNLHDWRQSYIGKTWMLDGYRFYREKSIKP